MRSSLPHELIEVFDRATSADFVTVDAHGAPTAHVVTPFLHDDEDCIDVTAPLGRPTPADQSARDPHVALLFRADAAGSATVLVQGTAAVDDRDLDANRARFARDRARKAPRALDRALPERARRLMSWYFSPIYVHIRPERIYVWRLGDASAEPKLFDAHLEEVRSGHSEEPLHGHAAPVGGRALWDARLNALGDGTVPAALAVVGPDGFPFAAQVTARADRRDGVVRIDETPIGMPVEPGLACLALREVGSLRHPLELRGDLLRDGAGWALSPQHVAGGDLGPAITPLERGRHELRRALRFRRTAQEQQRLRALR